MVGVNGVNEKWSVMVYSLKKRKVQLVTQQVLAIIVGDYQLLAERVANKRI